MAASFPVVVITGPRQSGKTTLARHIFSDRPYVSLENPDVRERAMGDPRGFITQYRQGAVFDEIQRAPELVSYLQQIVDECGEGCRFVLTGSQNFGLLSSVSQSLAGRAATLDLLPFSLSELYPKGFGVPALNDVLLRGLYPPVHDRSIEHSLWYSNYVRAYLERDVRQILNVKDIAQFQRFVRLCAARNGCLLNLSSLASDTGLTHTTISSWISILQASYIVFLLSPWYDNIGKRLIKTPKLYFYDTGLLCWLLSIENTDQLGIHSKRGEIFESLVTSEWIKHRFNQGKPQNAHFYRDRRGLEVDLLIAEGELLQPVEIKSSRTFSPAFIKPLQAFSRVKPTGLRDPILIYGGDESYVYQGVSVNSWRDCLQVW